MWTINGAQVYIQYMPYGAGISRIVYAANSGVIDADGSVDVIANGSTTTCDLGAINHKTVTMLSSVIDACVAGAGIESGRVAFLLTFTAPDTDIEVYSAYNVGGNARGTVVNTGWNEDRVVSMLDGEIGLGWTSCNGCVRITTGYMVSAWMNTINTDDFIRSVQRNSSSNSPNLDGVITFDGVTTRLEIRF